MNIRILIILGLLSLQVHAQVSENCIISPSIQSTNGCRFDFKQLKSTEVTQFQSYCTETKSFNEAEHVVIEDVAAFEQKLFKSYPKNFTQIKNGFVFTDQNGKQFTIQKKIFKTFSKEAIEYTILKKVNQYVVIEEIMYEDGKYTVIDLNTFTAYVLPGHPIFINKNVMFGCGMYDITIIDMERKQDVTLMFNEPLGNASYSTNNSVGMLFQTYSNDCKTFQFFTVTVGY